MRKMKKGLVVLLAVLLLLPSISAVAEETVSTVPEEGTVAAEELSGGDVSGNDVSKEEEIVNEESVEEETTGLDEEVDESALERVAYAAGAQSGTLSGGLSWSFDGTDTLTLSGTGTFDGYSGLNAGAMGVTKVVFSNCTVTGSMRNAFCRDSLIEEIDCSGLDSSEVTDMLQMFSDCYSLTRLDLSNLDTSKVTNMSRMFGRCYSLTALDLKSFDTSKVTDMSSMFDGCYSLTQLDVSSFDTSNVTNMSRMFAVGYFGKSSSLTQLNISSLNTSQVTDMSYMFSGCDCLTQLDVSSFDTSNVTNMTGMFQQCRSLTSLDLSNFTPVAMVGLGEMFHGCENLVSVDLDGFNTSQGVSMCVTFADCKSLTSLDLSSFDLSQDTFNEEEEVYFEDEDRLLMTFENCISLDTIKTPKSISASCSYYLPDSYYDAEIYATSGEVKLVTLLNASCANTTLRKCGEVPDAVKYVIYSEMLPDAVSGQSYSVTLGRLPSGMELKADGELCGIPMETGKFIFGTSQNVYAITVLDNTDVNAESRTDSGYEIIQRIPNFTTDSITTDTIVSNGTYSEFTDVYIDGQRLIKDTDYTSEEGSTRVTIYAQTFSRFNQVGVHTITMEFRKIDASGGSELKRAVQNYYINAPGSNSEDSSGNSSSGTTGSGSTGGSGSSSGSSNKNGSITTDESNTLEAEFIYYTVQPGDTLWKISEKFYGSGEFWERIYLVNTDVIQSPDRIYVGQVLKIYLSPDGSIITVPNDNDAGNASAVYYTVAPGDTLWKIAKKYYGNGRLWRRIYEANTAVISDPERLYVGWIIVVPSRS